MNILEAIDDGLFGAHLRKPSWAPWRAALGAMFGLPLAQAQSGLELYRSCTGRQAPPKGPCSEAWLICGRRSGKSFTLALIAVYLACFKDWSGCLGPGEVGTIMVLATDRKQARVIMRYISGLLAGSPMLEAMVINRTTEGLELSNRTMIEVHTASFRSVRGYTVVAALLDEVSFWRRTRRAPIPTAR